MCVYILTAGKTSAGFWQLLFQVWYLNGRMLNACKIYLMSLLNNSLVRGPLHGKKHDSEIAQVNHSQKMHKY